MNNYIRTFFPFSKKLTIQVYMGKSNLGLVAMASTAEKLE